MPKSRFNAVRERARATRHNPVGGRKPAANGQAPEEVTLPTASAPKREEDVLPILKSLPLDNSTTVEPSEVLWALTSVTDFLSDKTSRTQVLLPQHKLIARVLLQLTRQNDYQIKDAASGCLRNMCIEAGGKTCKALEDQGCVEKCIEEIKVTAKKLGLGDEKIVDANGNLEEQKQKMEEEAQLLKKPKEGLNRKQRRQLAKLEEAAAKKNGQKNTDAVMSDVVFTGNNGNEHSISSDKDAEQLLLYYSHMNNLVAIVWCLVEVTPKALEVCRRSANILTRIIISILPRALSSLEALHLALNDAYSSDDSHINIGNQDKTRKNKAVVLLAQTALNALVTLTDANPEFSAAVVGVSKEMLRHSQKAKNKAFVIEEENADSDSLKHGLSNMDALFKTTLFLQCLYHREETARGIIGLENQAASVALLSMAVIRNVQSSLPDSIRNCLKLDEVEIEFEEDALLISPWAAREGGKIKKTLGELEMHHSVDCLRQILWIAHSTDIEDRESILDVFQAQKFMYGDSVEPKKEADDALHNVLLALEILAELAGDREGWSAQSGQSKEKEEDVILADGQDDEEDEEMDYLENESDDEQSDASLDLLEETLHHSEGSQTVVHFKSSRYTDFFDDMEIGPLLYLSVQNQEGFAQSRVEDGGNVDEGIAASLRSVSIRALSVLNNLCLALASFAQTPPSQPQKPNNVIKTLHNWLEGREKKHNNQLGHIWKLSFEYASLAASLPCLSQSDDNTQAAQDSRKVLELCLCIMWSLCRCYEGVDGKRSAIVLAILPIDFAKDEDCLRAQKSLGVIPSLIAAYKTSKKLSSVSAAAQEDSTTIQLAPTPDGIRTHSLGVLSTIVRQSFVSMEDKEKIVTLIADALDVLPTASGLTSRLNSREIRDSTSMDAMVVAVNGIIDTFANEESQWDSLFGKLRLQSRLKRASLDVKSAVSSDYKI
jgi:hypothetical protein